MYLAYLPAVKSPLRKEIQYEEPELNELDYVLRYCIIDHTIKKISIRSPKCRSCLQEFRRLAKLKRDKKFSGRSLIGRSLHESIAHGHLSSARRCISDVKFNLKILYNGLDGIIRNYGEFVASSYSWDGEEGPAPYFGSIDMSYLSDHEFETRKKTRSREIDDISCEFPGTNVPLRGVFNFIISNQENSMIKDIVFPYDFRGLNENHKIFITKTDGDYYLSFTVAMFQGKLYLIDDLKVVFHNIKRNLIPSYSYNKRRYRLPQYRVFGSDQQEMDVENLFSVQEHCEYCGTVSIEKPQILSRYNRTRRIQQT